MNREADITFLPRFFRSCEQYPRHPALVFSDRTVAYRELAALVQGIRERIEATVPPTERRIAVHANQNVQTYAAILAILATGRAYVPLNPRNPPERNYSCLAQAEIQTVFRSRETPELERFLEESGSSISIVDLTAIAPSENTATIPAVDQAEVAYLLFTSGSTGAPKGVPVYHRNLECFLRAVLGTAEFEFSPSDRFLQMFDLTFDLSIMSFAVPLALGASCHVVPDDGPGFLGVAKTLEVGRISVALMVPSVLSFLERYFDEIRLPDMRYSLFCGEALNARLAQAWRSCVAGARIFNVYGPTEATIFCSTFELHGTADESGQYQGVVSIGKPMPGTRFAVVDDDLAAVAPQEKGELVILGGQVTDRYWQNSEKTAAAFVSLPDGTHGYRTGDIVFEQGGNFFYVGRADNQLKVDGYRVEAGEIEHHARALLGVRDAAAVGIAGANGKTTIYMFVETAGGMPETFPNDCRASLAQKLPAYMVPRKVYSVPTFPLNLNGKIDRKALAKLVTDAGLRDG